MFTAISGNKPLRIIPFLSYSLLFILALAWTPVYAQQQPPTAPSDEEVS